MAHIEHDLLKDADQVFLGDNKHLHDIANRAMMLWWNAWGRFQKAKGCEPTVNTTPTPNATWKALNPQGIRSQGGQCFKPSQG